MNWGSWGVNHSSETMSDLIKDAFSSGINSFDHADIYGGYTTEEIFGNAFLKTGIKREDVFFISKCDIMYPSDKLTVKIKKVFDLFTKKYNCSDDQLLLAWILKHPSNIYPVIGTTKAKRIKNSKESLKINLETIDWFEMLEASTGKRVA